jgi:hypothetical protein
MTVATVAALYVDVENGPYSKIPGVDCWGVERDARAYEGLYPVVAHPPCGPYGRFWWRYKGGEGGEECARLAVEDVRRCGGVLEHPAQSNLWPHSREPHPKRPRPVGDLPLPGAPPDRFGGWTLEVDQVWWGHPCHKRTWLYVVGVSPEQLPPRPPRWYLEVPTHDIVTKGAARGGRPELPKCLRHLTPPAFAEWLVEVARRSQP